MCALQWESYIVQFWHKILEKVAKQIYIKNNKYNNIIENKIDFFEQLLTNYEERRKKKKNKRHNKGTTIT